ncbi:33 kDa protein [Simian adenovirus 3]|uniref:33 kDa protein n=1 Tax=Simian adenovirus 3 TaxID=38420 RepID=A0A9W3HRI2_9ADEN|nr:33 kDa protein [Simian adenovirus 3]AAT84632.1 33 kDa protein [Simian adenovirus 3]UEC95852.1 33 kDa protein [Simian adenovirus ER]
MPPKKNTSQWNMTETEEEEWSSVSNSETEEEPWPEGSNGEEDTEEGEVFAEEPSPVPPKSQPAASAQEPAHIRRWDSKTKKPAPKRTAKKTQQLPAGGLRLSAREPPATRELRNRIFPTLYAIFQQSRGQQQELKIKNRTLRSLTRSCLYHKSEEQLQRTLEDAEALFQKYCATTLNN